MGAIVLPGSQHTHQPMVKLGKVLRISADRKELRYLPLEDIGGNFYWCTAGRLGRIA